MLWKTMALSAAFASGGGAAFGAEITRPPAPKPRKITSFELSDRRIDMIACAPSPLDGDMRLSTPLRYSRIDQMPGYPKPAMVSIDFRVRF